MDTGTVITILQEKGGVGKSLATMNIAYYLCRTKTVLIIDLDGQAADITYYMLGNSASSSRADVLTIMDVFRGKADIEDVIIPVELNLHIVPANVDVASLSQTDKISVFKKTIEKLKLKYDYILIDVTPSPTWAHLLALSSEGQKIIPIINADASSLKALVSLDQSVQEVQQTTNPSAKYLGIIVNRYNGRTNLSKEIVSEAERLAEQMGTSLFDTKIRQSVVLSEQTISHKSIYDYAPGTSAAKDYENLSKEIIKRINKKGNQ